MDDRTRLLTELCANGWKPQLMTGLFVLLVRYHFGTATNIRDSSIRHLVWRARSTSPTATNTSLIVEDGLVVTPLQTGQRPAILIRRGAWEWQKRTIGDLEQVNTDGSTSYFKTFSGEHKLRCLSYKGAEAENLAGELADYLLAFGPQIQKDYWLSSFDVASLSPAENSRETHELVVAELTVRYTGQITWSLSPQSPPLTIMNLVPTVEV